jgi:predicted transcriptional regulator
MPELRISVTAARRIARIAARDGCPRQRVLEEALKAGLDYEEWFRRAVAKGLADLDAGRTLSHRQVLKNLARRKAAFARTLKKAA